MARLICRIVCLFDSSCLLVFVGSYSCILLLRVNKTMFCVFVICQTKEYVFRLHGAYVNVLVRECERESERKRKEERDRSNTESATIDADTK